MDERIVVGLDIGSAKVCAVAGRLTGSRAYPTLEVLGVGEAPSGGVAKGAVVNINKTVDAINKAIEEASNQSNLNINVVNVGFSGHHISARKQAGSITRSSAGEEVTKDDIDHLLGDMYRTLMQPGTEIVHVLPMDFSVDSETISEDPVGRIGVRLGAEFQLITAKTDSAQNTRRCIERTERKLTRELTLLSPLASALAVLTQEERDAGVALVDIGCGTTDLAVFHKGVLRHVAVFPWAGKSLTDDIEQGCKVMAHQAEKLKVKFGGADPAAFRLNQVVSVPGLANQRPKDVLMKNIALISAERLGEIAAMVLADIRKAGYEDKLLGGIVLTGGTSDMDGIESVFERVTGMPSRVGRPERLAQNARAELVSHPAYATAIGLVWAGFKLPDDRISFITDPGPTRTQGNGPSGYGSQPAAPSRQEEPGEGWVLSLMKKMGKVFKPDIDGRETDPY
jgi:cell division protein FtsA